MANYLHLLIKIFYNPDYFERIVLPLLDLPMDAHVLDVGCGYGGLSFTLAGLRPALRITGVDPEAGTLESARETAAQNCWDDLLFEQGDGQELGYPDEHFNAVTCQTVLTHVCDARAVLNEMRKVLKPGGVFLAAEYADYGEPSYYSNLEGEGRTWPGVSRQLARLGGVSKKHAGCTRRRTPRVCSRLLMSES